MKEEERELVHAVVEWIKTARKAYGNPEWIPYPADIDHSALLNRLMDGKAPLPYAPTRSFSYPWYDLYDKPMEDQYVVDFHIRDDDVAIINQSAWNIVDEIEKDVHYVVTYQNLPDVFDLQLKPYIRKVFQASTKQMVDVPSEGWFIKKR